MKLWQVSWWPCKLLLTVLRTSQLINLKQDFEAARQAYPGTVRGLETEYAYYLDVLKRKKLKECNITPLLLPAIQAQIRQREGKDWNPDWKHFKAWIFNKWWEAVDAESKKPKAACFKCGGEWSSTFFHPKLKKEVRSCYPCKVKERGY